MSTMAKSLNNILVLEELSKKDTCIHKIHPLSKLIVTISFLIIVLSFGKYEINSLIPLFIFPIIIMSIADIPVLLILKRILIVLPIIIGIGIFNPILDQRLMFNIGNINFSYGFISFISILIKFTLTVSASLLLIATTGMNNVALALRMLKLPKIFVLQFLLTYRYITVLIEEVMQTTQAYSLRAPRQKGINFKDWGSLTGQLLLRTISRSERIYIAMCCRGFDGEYHTDSEKKLSYLDIIYIMICLIFFFIIRYFNLPKIIGLLVTGGLKP